MKFVDLSYKEFKTTDIARCLKARYTAAPTNHACEDSGVLIGGDDMEIKGGANSTAPNVAVRAVLTPDREEKQQNGRRMKDEGEPMFTLTAQDRHGVDIIDDQGRANKKLTPSDICPTLRAQSHGNEPKVIGGVGEKTFGKQYPQGNRIYDVEHISTALQAKSGNASNGSVLIGGQNVRIRRLTPRECWRLQGFPDEYFDKAKAAGLSDSALYKAAGNAVTVNVAYAIGLKLKEIENE